MTEVRVHLLKACVVNPPPVTDRGLLPAALIGAIAPSLIETALSGVATALKKAGSAETVQVVGTAIESLYVADAQQALRVNPALGCILAVWYQPHDDKTADDRVATLLKREGLIPADVSVAGVFEAIVRTTADGTAWFLDTRHFSVRTFVGDRHKDRRSFVISAALATPSADPEGHTVALGLVDLGIVERNASLVADRRAEDAYPRYRSNLMPWPPIGTASKGAYDRDVAAGRAAGCGYMPVTVTVTVSETAEGSAFLLALGELIGGSAKGVGSALGKQLVQQVSSGVSDAAVDAEKLYDDELKARVDEAKAREALSEAAGEAQAAARLTWELAARRVAWRTRLREAAGLPARSPLDLGR
jgi:hypothetical protein